MRRYVSLAVLLVLSTLAFSRARPPQQVAPTAVKAKRTLRIPRSDSLTLDDLKPRVARLAMLRTELKNRRFLASVARNRPGIDLRAVARQFNVRLAPELRELSIRDIEIEVYEIEEVFITVGLTYGPEDIEDIYEEPPPDPASVPPFVDNEKVLYVSRSVVAIVKRTAMTKVGNEWHLQLTPFNTILGGYGDYCEFETSYNAPATRAAGTGFLVAPDIIATAGHVIDRLSMDPSAALDSIYFVFDFVLKSDGETKAVFTEDEVYEGAEVIEKRTGMQADWALVRLDRAAVDRDPLEYRQSGKIDDNASIYMIGHPNGLPQKYSGPASVTENTPCAYFLGNLDTGPYNSGSPVFSADNHSVEGILVRDIGNFEEICDCFKAAQYSPRMGIPGVDVVRTTEFAGYLSNPDSYLVRCEVDDGDLAAIISFPADTLYMENGEFVRLDYDNWGIELLVSTTCKILYYPERGTVWDITSVPGTDLTKMEQACYP